jgi:hypothetical protein
MSGQQKRGHNADVNELAGKMFKMSTTGRVPAPEVVAAHQKDVQMDEPRGDLYDAKDDLIKQAKSIKRMQNLLTRYATSLDTFLKKVEQNETLEIYAYAVLPSQLKIFKERNIATMKQTLEALESYPAKLIEEVYGMPKTTLDQVARAQGFSASYVKRTHRDTLNADFSKLNLLPAQLLIRGLAPTVVHVQYKGQVIDGPQWMKVVNAFKRTFPNYKFTPIEMRYINEWLHTGIANFYGKRFKAIKPAESAELKAALTQSFGNAGAAYFGTSPLVASPSPPPSQNSDDKY